MGVFICALCGDYCESHDGCEELKPKNPANYELICLDCSIEREEENGTN